jgi:hypothetical protein
LTRKKNNNNEKTKLTQIDARGRPEEQSLDGIPAALKTASSLTAAAVTNQIEGDHSQTNERRLGYRNIAARVRERVVVKAPFRILTGATATIYFDKKKIQRRLTTWWS